MNRAGRSFNSGFTLIEMLLAVAIFAVVSSSLYFSMRTGILMYKRSEEGLRQSHAITFFLNRIDKELKNAFFYLPEPFDGAQERLSFVTLRQSYSDDEDFVDIVKVTYSTNGKSITKETEFLSRKTEVVKEKDILTGVLQDISFTYAYYDPDEEEIEWDDEWDGEELQTLPKGIKVILEVVFEDAENEDYKEYVLERFLYIPDGSWGKLDAV